MDGASSGIFNSETILRISAIVTVLLLATSCFAGVNITSPSNGAGVGAPIHVTASATPNAGNTISSMIIYLDNVNVYTKYANSIDTSISSGTGWHTILVKSWDNHGTIYQSSVSVNVGGAPAPAPAPAPTGGGTNLEQQSGWGSCDVCAGAGGMGPAAPHGLTQNLAAPSLDGKAAQFWMGGTHPYSDVLWWKKVLVENQVAQNRAAHNFVYDAYFYITDSAAAQSLEWDINQFVDGRSYIFGNQCSYRSAGTWDVWDNVGNRWISTGIKCPVLTGYTWHHVVLEAERTWDNKLHYISFTMDGEKHYLNWYYPSTSTTWSGITVNYQMDGDYKQTNYSTWLDKLNLNYW